MRLLPEGHARWLLLIPVFLVGAGLLASPAPHPDAGADGAPGGNVVDPEAPTSGSPRDTSVPDSAHPTAARSSPADAPVQERAGLGPQARPALPAPGSGARQVRLGRAVAWVDGTPIPYSPASIFVLPGEEVHIDVEPGPRHQRLLRHATPDPVPEGDGGKGRGPDTGGGVPGSLEPLDDDTWLWTAPERPGTYGLEVRSGMETEVRLRAFVMVPADEVAEGRLNGYRVGRYPRVPLRGDTMYVRPDGFVEVTEENRELRVSPRFRLKHFETKQGGGFPRYVVLQRRLLTKLELVVDALAERGYPVSSLHVMSGYRTPSYNASLGNGRYSRHQWGDASDVFVDEDGDGRMDDLDGDGRVTRDDARVLFEIVDSLDQALDTRRLRGGLGLYGPAPHRGPFVHIDTRGSLARW